MREFILGLGRNIATLAGAALATVAALAFLFVLALSALGFTDSPYIGIFGFVVVPALFVLGLLLIPIGLRIERRRDRLALERGERPRALPVWDLNDARTRRAFGTFVLLTLVNLAIVGTAGFKAVEVMDSTEFCGTACHSVMAPEYANYLRSPHARVGCVDCHIGPGASWFVKSKLSGSWQLISVNLNLYPRPIPTPVENLRPARETCEQCHWPAKFVGDRLRVFTHYAEDEANTETKSVLLLRVGGVQGRAAQGIHWHVDPSIRIRYLSDAKREDIREVELTRAGGEVEVFRRGGAETAPGEERTWRTMDCVDCHNRPTHIYRPAEEEIDDAIRLGAIDPSLPWVRREGMAALRAGYESHGAATEGIRRRIESFYAASYPEASAAARDRIAAAADELGRIYRVNVWPSMNIRWGTYPNHIGHTWTVGCFRCHDEEHETAGGRTISQDCTTCHALLAQDERDPEILRQINP